MPRSNDMGSSRRSRTEGSYYADSRPPSVHSSDFEYITPEEREGDDQSSSNAQSRVTFNQGPREGLKYTGTDGDGQTYSVSAGEHGARVTYETENGYGGQASLSADGGVHASIHTGDFRAGYDSTRGYYIEPRLSEQVGQVGVTYNQNPHEGPAITYQTDNNGAYRTVLGPNGPSVSYERGDGYGGHVSVPNNGGVNAEVHSSYLRGFYESGDGRTGDDRFDLEPRFDSQRHEGSGRDRRDRRDRRNN